MSRFFDEPVLSDEQEEFCEKKKGRNGGHSPEALQNDYRNRMPYHYIEDGVSDGYYYWQYGETIDLSIILQDEFSFGEDEENTYIPVVDFLKDSDYKIGLELKDFRGNTIAFQEVKAKDLVYKEDEVRVVFTINQDLSAIMLPSTYRLYVSIYKSILNDNRELTVLYNRTLTENGIEIRVRGGGKA